MHEALQQRICPPDFIRIADRHPEVPGNPVLKPEAEEKPSGDTALAKYNSRIPDIWLKLVTMPGQTLCLKQRAARTDPDFTGDR